MKISTPALSLAAGNELDPREPDDESFRPSSLNQRTYQTLREAILSGGFMPGSTLNIRPIAAMLGVSPTPVRDALSRLQADGALEALPNRAFRLPVPSIEEYRQLLIMRIRLEECAVQHAAALITPAEVLKVSDLYDEMSSLVDRPSDEYLAVHRRFHFMIYDAARMPLLREAIERLWLRIGPLMHASSNEQEQPLDDKTHAEIVRSLKAADPFAATIAVRDDLTHARGPVLAYLSNFDKRSAPSE